MNSSIELKRHSLSHIMAQAVLEMFPEAKLAIGPAIDNGFYYDFELPRTLMPEDLPLLQKRMERIIKENQVFECYTEPIAKAIDFYKKLKQEFKVELIADLKKAGEKEVSFYKNSTFVDLCRGPHVESTGKIQNGSFCLDKIAGAYWRGDEKRPMLQRIYGLAFDTKKELNEYIQMRKEAEKRDHRKLGKELGLFTFSDNVGPGLPLWLPNGAVMIEELEKFAKEEEFKAGYVRVRTPHITKGKLYELSGHLSHYKVSMFPPMKLDGDEEEYYLKPMNCPHHHMCFAATPRSYRDLPLRYAEYGTCYRYEDSGALFGLMRVRSLQMNDAHLYCTEDQFEQEFIAVTEMYLRYFKRFNIKKYVMRLSLHDPRELGRKYLDEPELWKRTEDMVRRAMIKAKVPFVEVPNEAAFYGPKIDIEVESAIGREFTLATNQVDFGIPKRMGLSYIDEKGNPQVPLCIHRAPLGTHERFIGFLIEHFGGMFPVWLAPVQVQILPIADAHVAEAKKIVDALRAQFIRADVVLPTETLGKRIRNAELLKVPYMAVLGDKEIEAKKLNIRDYKTKAQTEFAVEAFTGKILEEIRTRAL
ncbi:threonine--tRNA ligase [Candidatus Peregrinibacteria bacterium]|nr:threonine--tRNA ligase [Candidatus Peregrinibacteria bacterium]